MENYFDKITDLLILYGPKIIGALLVLIVGLIIIKTLMKIIKKGFEKRNMEPSLNKFLISLISITLKLLIWISVLGMIGIKMTSFIAILGAAGLALGLALSGTLQNFAGGVMILLFKPFKTGDFIEVLSYMGTVKEIQIFNTILLSLDNKTIIIPNAQVSNSSLTNFSKEPIRRVDWSFGIGYGDDIAKTKKILLSLIKADNRILKDPEPFIAVGELADSSVNIVCRGWVKGENYWGVFFDMNENVYNAFNKEGINIPFPQMDVHINK